MARPGAWILGLVLVAGAAVTATAIDGADEDSADIDLGITLREVIAEPAVYYDRFLVVSGRVRELAPDDVEAGGDRGGRREPVPAFSLGAELDDQLLVVAEAGDSFDPVHRGDVVQVEGVLHEFGSPALRERIPDSDRFAGDWFEGWRGEPALVAASIDRTPPDEADERAPSLR